MSPADGPASTHSSASARAASAVRAPCACVYHAVLHGAWRFMLVGLGGFGVWAGAGSWFYRTTGELGLYAASAVVFVVLAGVMMHPLMAGPSPVRRFYAVFTPAFLGYAAVWCGFWFLFRAGLGEWLGALAGSTAFCAIARTRFGSGASLWPGVVGFFLAHSTGYFSGGVAMSYLTGPEGAWLLDGLRRSQIGLVGKLVWGACYGLGFGGGLGYVFHRFQKELAA